MEKPIRDEVISLRRSGQIEKASAITRGKGAAHVQITVNAITKLADFAENKASEFMTEADAARQETQRMMWIVMGLFVLLGTGISYFVFRSIISPLHILISVSKSAAQGDLGRQIEHDSQDELGELASIFNEILAGIVASNEEIQLKSTALDTAANAILITDAEGEIIWVNPSYLHLSGFNSEELLGKKYLELVVEDKELNTEMWQSVRSGQVWHGEITNYRKDGSDYFTEQTVTPVQDDEDTVSHVVIIKTDITQRKNLEDQLAQAQKLESIGQLAAGVAHEIKTPIQYVGDNAKFIKSSFDEIEQLIQIYSNAIVQAKEGSLSAEDILQLEEEIEEADLAYLVEEIPRAIEQSIEGINRVTNIVQSMKDFSHPGQEEKTWANLNKTLVSTRTVATNEWKYVADLELDLDPDLPEIPCLPGKLSQVFLNLIVNAAHAIEGAQKGEITEKGTITVRTRSEEEWVEIQISDTGTGIPEHARYSLFEPFFTTKEIGKGTGQGLAISRAVIEDEHQGQIYFETEMGVGTTFFIRLPRQLKAAAVL